MIALIVFPSMGVWAMKTRLRYFIQPLEKDIHSTKNRTAAYQQAQQFRDKLQTQINQLLNTTVMKK